jgi:hypothetical protein
MRGKVSNLDVDILLVLPGGKNSGQPVLPLDRRLSARPIPGQEYPRRSRELRTDDFAPHRARSDSNLRIIPDALVFPGVAASLHMQLVIIFSKPHGRTYSRTALAERSKANVFLPPNLPRDGHGHIVR